MAGGSAEPKGLHIAKGNQRRMAEESTQRHPCTPLRKDILQSQGCQLPNHQLQTVAVACGYDLVNHHHALADAEACAMIAKKLLV